MSDEIKANIQREVDEVWNKGNVDVLDDLYTASFVRHHPPVSGC